MSATIRRDDYNSDQSLSIGDSFDTLQDINHQLEKENLESCSLIIGKTRSRLFLNYKPLFVQYSGVNWNVSHI